MNLEQNHSWESDGRDSNYPVRRLISLGPIKDLILPLHLKTSETTKEQERQVELPGVEPRAFYANALPLSYSSHQLINNPTQLPSETIMYCMWHLPESNTQNYRGGFSSDPQHCSTEHMQRHTSKLSLPPTVTFMGLHDVISTDLSLFSVFYY